MLDRLFICTVSMQCGDAIDAKARLFNGALSANNGEQHYPECSRTKPAFLISGLEYSQTDLTAFTKGKLSASERRRRQMEGRERGGTRGGRREK